MDEVETDERFAHIHKDPRFRRVPKKERKVKIDSRFQSMFENKFKVKATVDKRGKPTATTTKENLRKFYELDEEEEKDGNRKASDDEEEDDNVERDTSSEASSSDEEEEVTSSSEEEGDSSSSEDEDNCEDVGDLVDPSAKLSHNWNDVDHGAPEAEDATSRLAVCNMNWDRIRAKDLFVLLHSFLPAGGHIKSVTIYPSEFGLERMAEEEKLGPRELRAKAENSDGGEVREGEEFDAETLRLYQLNRLKYYYTVVECDSKESAGAIYDECDGMEYESSAAKLDLRFIPDDMTFDHTPKDQCLRLPEASTYKPAVFTTTALCQQKVELTWDETDVERLQATMKKFTDDDLEEEKLQGLIASSSEEEKEDVENGVDPFQHSSTDAVNSTGGSMQTGVNDFDSDNSDKGNKKSKNKYRSLLETLEDEEDADGKQEAFMEITWAPSLKSTTDSAKKKKKAEKLTPWEEYRQKKKEKKKQKRLEQKREKVEMKRKELGMSGEDVGFDDPFFNDESEDETMPSKKKDKKKKKKKGKEKVAEEMLTPEEKAVREKQKAALELLMQDSDGLNHFSLDKLLEKESKKKKKGKKKKKNADSAKDVDNVDTFQMNLEDNRFAAVYNSRMYNIDPSAPEFKETKGMKALIDEKLKRREKGELEVEKTVPDSLKRKAVNEEDNKDSFNSPPQQSVSSLVRSVKAKTEHFQMMKKMKKRL